MSTQSNVFSFGDWRFFRFFFAQQEREFRRTVAFFSFFAFLFGTFFGFGFAKFFFPDFFGAQASTAAIESSWTPGPVGNWIWSTDSTLTEVASIEGAANWNQDSWDWSWEELSTTDSDNSVASSLNWNDAHQWDRQWERSWQERWETRA